MSNEGKKFLRPAKDANGEPFQVYIPRKGRNISPEGEALTVDAYIEKRIQAGELEEFAPKAKSGKADNNQTSGGSK